MESLEELKQCIDELYIYIMGSFEIELSTKRKMLKALHRIDIIMRNLKEKGET